MLALRQFYATAYVSATSALGENFVFLIDYGVRLLRVVVLLSLWRLILGGSAAASPMPLAAVLTYTLIAEVFNEQIYVRTTLAETFWSGSVASRFLWPVGVVAQFAAEMVGRWTLNFGLFSLPLLLAAPLLGVDPRPASATAGVLFFVSLALGISVGLALEFFFGAMIVALEQPVWLVEWVRAAVSTLLSGSLLPLALYPWGIGDLFAWLPFASVAWAPLAIYTGVGEPLRLLLVQAAWSVLLWPLTMWFWRANRQKLVAHGG